MVLRNTTTGPWGIAETVRDIMDKKSPLYLPEEYGGINYTGPDFLNATDEDLLYVLNHLMNTRTNDGTYWARGLTSPDGRRTLKLSSDNNLPFKYACIFKSYLSPSLLDIHLSLSSSLVRI